MRFNKVQILKHFFAECVFKESKSRKHEAESEYVVVVFISLCENQRK